MANGEDRRTSFRREEDHEMAHWRGSIDARLAQLESLVSDNTRQTNRSNVAVARIEENVKGLVEDIDRLTQGLSGAGETLERGRLEAVAELKQEMSQRKVAKQDWILGIAGLIVALITSSLFTAVLVGALK